MELGAMTLLMAPDTPPHFTGALWVVLKNYVNWCTLVSEN